MAARRSRTRPACAKGPPARCISLIFAIPTATNCARSTACRRELSDQDGGGPPLPGGPPPAATRVRRCASAVLQPIAEPNHAALQDLGACQNHRADRRCDAGVLVAGIEDARRA